MRGNANPMVFRIKLKDETGRVVGEKDCVNYAGLLELAHRDRLRSIETTLVQAPSKDNGMMAIVRAVVQTSRGSFSGIGDATPENVSARVRPHFLRMAETRAVSRAIRSAVNIGAVSIEELGDDLSDDSAFARSATLGGGPTTPTDGTGVPANDNSGQPASRPVIAPPHSAGPNGSRPMSDGRASDQQRKFVFRLLAERNITGDAVREMIQRELGVESLQEASRHAVSSFIDKIKADGYGAQPESGEQG